jgi:hypothetical protein
VLPWSRTRPQSTTLNSFLNALPTKKANTLSTRAQSPDPAGMCARLLRWLTRIWLASHCSPRVC